MQQRCALDEDDAATAKAELSITNESKKNADVATKKICEENPNNHKRIECLGVEWFNELHDDANIGMKEALQRVTLPSIQSVRKLAHDVALDVMLYLTEEFRQRILRIVVEKINLMYIQFCELNPTFVKLGGKCSLVGHSLGTVILYDVLAMQSAPDLPAHLKLNFDPTAYFALGSPLGMFLTLRNSAAKVHNAQGSGSSELSMAVLNEDILSSSYSFPTCKQYFNIFNKNDPVAYRVEPLADPSMQHEEPLLVPHYDGGLRPQYLLKSVASSISETWRTLSSPSGWFKATTSTNCSTTTVLQNATPVSNGKSAPCSLALQHNSSDKSVPRLSSPQMEAARRRARKICPPDSLPHVHLNGGRRFDFLLQESAMEVANEYLSSLTSHTSYFEQKDVARFIVAMLVS